MRRVHLFVALLTALAVGVPAPSPAEAAPPSAAPATVEALQRRIDRRVWESPGREAMTEAAQRLLAMRLGLWRAPVPNTPAPPPDAGLSATEETPGTDVRVNDLAGDLRSACTTQSETSIRGFGQNLVVAFNDSAEGCKALDSYTGFAHSSDGGTTWTDGGKVPPPPGGFSGGDPSLAVDRQGRFYVATLANERGIGPGTVGPGVSQIAGRSMLAVYASDDGGRTWSQPTDGTAGMIGAHDKELLAVDNSGGPHDGTVYLVWTDFSNYKGVIRLSRSTDRGATWSEPIRLSLNDGYNQGAVPTIGPDGEVHVVWQTQNTQSPVVFFTSSTDGGVTFSEPAIIRKVRAVGEPGACSGAPSRNAMNGGIRTLVWPMIDVDRTPITGPDDPPPHRGTIYVTYGSRSDDDAGDIYLIRSTDGGATWDPPAPSPGIRVNDDGTTRDQFWPAIATKPQGEVALMWYDRRGDPANVQIDVYASRSTDGGTTWSPNYRVSDVAFEGIGNNSVTQDPGVSDCYMGDYNQLTPFGSGYAAAWGDNRDRYPAGAGGTRSDANVYFDRVAFSEETSTVGSMEATETQAGVEVTGGVTFGGGAPVTVGTDPAGDGPVPGADLISASIAALSPTALEFRLGVGNMPPALDGTPEVIHYNWSLKVGPDGSQTRYLLQAVRSAQYVSAGSTEPVFQLLRCGAGPATGECLPVRDLEGSMTGGVVRFVVPTGQIAAGPGAVVATGDTGVVSTVGASGAGWFDNLGGDAIPVQPFTVPTPAVVIGVAPEGTPDEDIALSTQAEIGLWMNSFRGVLPALAPGRYDVVAMACYDGGCGPRRRTPLTVG